MLVALLAGSSSPQTLRASLPSLDSAASSTGRLSIGGLMADLPKLSVKLSAADEAMEVRCSLSLVRRRHVGCLQSHHGAQQPAGVRDVLTSYTLAGACGSTCGSDCQAYLQEHAEAHVDLTSCVAKKYSFPDHTPLSDLQLPFQSLLDAWHNAFLCRLQINLH